MIYNDKLLQEISLKGGDIFQSIRQPDNNKLHEGDLVFIYPILIDVVLEKRWGGTIRDFIATVFMNRVKQANVLNVYTDATSPGTVKSGSSEINPAQKLKETLGRSPKDEVVVDDVFGKANDLQKRYDYVDTLSRMREYVKDQIHNDPNFRDLRPIVSEVVAQNLVPIPLIIGTNSMKIHSSVLYWILFVAAGQKIPLDRASSLTKIQSLIRQIPSDNYERFLTGVVPNESISSDRKLEQLISGIYDTTDKAIQLRLGPLLDINKWHEEMPTKVNVARLSTAVAQTMEAQQNLSTRASTAYKSFIGNEVVGLMQSITHAIVSEGEIDISSKLSRFVQDVTDVRPSYITVYDYIIGSFNSASGQEADDIDALDGMIRTATSMCKDNKEINVNQIFSKLSNLTFSVGGGSDNYLYGGTRSGETLVNFSSELVKIGATLKSFSVTLEEWISDLGGDGAIKTVSDRKKKIAEIVRDYFEGDWDTRAGAITASDPANAAQLGYPGGGFRGTPIPGQKTLFNSLRFQQLTGGPTSNADQTAFENSVYNAITEICHFLLLFCFFSFFCDYLREVEAEVTVQKRDAVSFPNYVLVTRVEYITRIFWALANRNFENEIKREEGEDDVEGFQKKSKLRFWKSSSEQSRFIESLDDKMRYILSKDDYRSYDRYNDEEKPKRALELIAKVKRIGISSNTSQTRFQKVKRFASGKPLKYTEADLNRIEAEIKSIPTYKKDAQAKGIDTTQFQLSSASDLSKQIRLIKERLKLPNIVVVDEKSRKVYYMLMHMNRVMNLDLGTMNSYVNQQKDILSVF